jgi:hypothetical protein
MVVGVMAFWRFVWVFGDLLLDLSWYLVRLGKSALCS